MEQFVIQGGNVLKGTVEIGGSKNAALPILIASVMANDYVTIDNIPNVNDVDILLNVIKKIGAFVQRVDEHKVVINGSAINKFTIDDDIVREIRASYYFLGAFIGKYKEVNVVLPGGCAIGKRPIDLHLKGFEALGIVCGIDNDLIRINVDKLIGGHVYLDNPSVGATINIMLAAVLADDVTIIENAAKEPHIVDTANFLNSMGASICGAGTNIIRIVGVSYLHGCKYSIIPDQIEAGTFMMAAAITHGDILLKNVIPEHLRAITSKLLDIGCYVYEGDDIIRVVGPNKLKNTHVTTLPYPGYPTDMQPQIMAALVIADGTSIINETIFENRFHHVKELVKMGARIKLNVSVAIINGVESLKGADILISDLRAGAALVLAALAAEGTTILHNIVFIKRGYENFDQKLIKLGACIKLIESE